MQPILSASILSANFSSLSDQIRSAEEAGIDWIHIDVMDGRFVPNITMGPMVVETCRSITNLPLDVHLMIEHPEQHIDAFAAAGADWISVHIEDNPNIHRTLQRIRSLGCQPGVVLNPGTPASRVTATLPFVDLVLVMTVNPGFGGQAFIPEMLGKITELGEWLKLHKPEAYLQVDGGISVATLPDTLQAGANNFVAGNAIFKHPQGIQTGVAELRKVIK